MMDVLSDGRRRAAARRRRVLACVAAGALFLLAFSASAWGQQAAWRIDSLSNSTVAPGGQLQYNVQITNVGDADGDGSEIDVTASLPPGLTAVSATMADAFFESFPACTAGDGSSPVAGASDVKCTDMNQIFDQLDAPGGNFHTLELVAAVDLSASGTVKATFQVSGGGASAPASTVDPTLVTDAAPSFGIAAFDGQVASNPAGDPETRAGADPYSASTSIDFNTMTNPNPAIGPLWPVAPAKDVVVDLPPGFIGNPTGVAQCNSSDLATSIGPKAIESCPPTAQVGTTMVRLNSILDSPTQGALIGASSLFGPVPVFNMVPPPGVPARFGFNVAGTVVTLDASVRTGSDYGVTVIVKNVSEGVAVGGTTLSLWGDPSDPSHDPDRACPGQPAPWQGGVTAADPTCASQTPAAAIPKTAFLRNPTSCTPTGVGLPTALHIDSWPNPGRLNADGTPDLTDPNWQSASFTSHLPPAYPSPPGDFGTPQGPTGCENVPFDPKLTGQTQGPGRANAPSGFAFDLTLPQSDDPGVIAEADLKKAVVTLPQGVRVSPSSANGLGACSPEQIALSSAADPTCPDSSKLGTVTIDTPLLKQQVTGSIYLAAPHANPFGSLLAVYLVASAAGVTIKLPGEVTTDPTTGQITTTFDNNPQLPFSHLHLQFDGGPRAALVTPKACGTYTTDAQLTSWSGKTVDSKSSFTVVANSDGSSCSAPGFSPGFSAGTVTPVAGADSTFALRLTRGDQDQELGSLAVDMPTGLLARISNTVLCPDGAAAAGTCTDGSLIGNVTVGAGAGSTPFYISTGRAYITGPYKGAPYGLSIVVPAVAGPFDLGNVVVRAAAFVNRTTAQLKVVSDPLPTILQGIPLDVRDVRVNVDKSHFIVNPTSCAPKQVAATVGSTAGAIAHVSEHFGVTNCAALGFAPKLSMTIGSRGHTRAGSSTPVTATVTMPKGDANLRTTSVTLPASLNALLPVVNRACTRAQFDAGHCEGAKAGTAVAVTPLLRDPLRGSVYFVKTSSGHLPNLVVALRGQVDLDVTAKISIPGGKRLGTTFATIPDAPVSKFTLRIVSGRQGPVGVATNLCSAKARNSPASVGYRAQSGKVVQVNQPVHIAGCPKAAKARKAKQRR
jgi:uncharacterized repeat protein (TIGR01451 family)